VGKNRNADVILVGKLQGRNLFGRHGPGWADNIKADLEEV
jgi:hypothetical protein